MGSERMTQADVARRSGLSPQVVNSLLRGEMKVLPSRVTFDGLRWAFPAVPYSAFVLRAAASMGIPVEDQPAVDYSGLSNVALIGILKDRLEGGQGWSATRGSEESRDEAVRPNVDLSDQVLTARHMANRGKALRAQLDELGDESQDDGGEDPA